MLKYWLQLNSCYPRHYVIVAIKKNSYLYQSLKKIICGRLTKVARKIILKRVFQECLSIFDLEKLIWKAF